MSALCWVPGAGGLLGSSVTRALGGQVRTWRPREPIAWADPPAALRQVSAAVAAFLADAGSQPWHIAWCAGAGVTATQAAELQQERLLLAALLDGVRRAPAQRPQERPGSIFLASSAGALYAGSALPPFDESTPVAPVSPYGQAKLDMEHLARAWARETGNCVFVGRIANLYGPGQNLRKPQGLISQIIRSHLLRAPISIYVPLDTLRDFIYADDCGELVADALHLARQGRLRGGEVVTKILASQQAITVGGLLGEMRRIFKRSPQIVLASSPQSGFQARDLRLRSRIWPDLDSRPLTPLSVGIHATTLQLGALLGQGRLNDIRPAGSTSPPRYRRAPC